MTGTYLRVTSSVVDGAADFDLLFGTSGISPLPQLGFEFAVDRTGSGQTVMLLHCPAAGSSETVTGVQTALFLSCYMENFPASTVGSEKISEGSDFPYSVRWRFWKI